MGRQRAEIGSADRLAHGEEQQARRAGCGERQQAKIGLEIGWCYRRRRADEPPGEIVGPAVEAAAKALAVARWGARDGHVLVAAGIAQDPDLARLVAHHQYAP